MEKSRSLETELKALEKLMAEIYGQSLPRDGRLSKETGILSLLLCGIAENLTEIKWLLKEKLDG